MRTKEFLSKLEHDRIVSAIREAESKTSGEIRVFIQRGKLSIDPLVAAQKKFQGLGMQNTRDRNAVLIFVAPRVHKFAVVGDKAIHDMCGEEFWQRIIEGMGSHFRNERFSDAIVHGIDEVGKVLAAHFPPNAQVLQRIAGRNRWNVSQAAPAAARALPALAKLPIWSLFNAPQRVFEITPLVPGFPSLDVKPYSPGETRCLERMKAEGRRMMFVVFFFHNSSFLLHP